ncbi:hypothetical protein AVEN_63522-1 [Araneus ventricosus]|uniref:Histone-lysine N-methyltransferase SETMAR n=1 Tax=Araneus ventricosus TaxID=182803 RepID=A0A4Y2VJW6_ARAVE|nr:hypothetical protein AVEN_63522-1 [Araneus ventricosus]
MNAVSIPGSEELEVLSPSCIEIVESPDLAPSDFRLFGPLEKHLAGRHFKTDVEVQKAVIKWFCDLDPGFFYAGFDRLVYRWYKCLNNHGDFVGKQFVPVPFYLCLSL